MSNLGVGERGGLVSICAVCNEAQYERQGMHSAACVRFRRLEKLVLLLADNLCGPWGVPVLSHTTDVGQAIRTALEEIRRDIKEGR